MGPQCTATGPSCQTGFFCQNDTCMPVTCSPTNKTGTCPPPDQTCLNGACVQGSCTTKPADYCVAPNDHCNPVSGNCEQSKCDAQHPDGICAVGFACVAGVCEVPPCSPQFPGGVCSQVPNVQICANGACVEPPCSTINPEGACTLADGNTDPTRVCCDSTLRSQRNGDCIVGQCTKRDCAPTVPAGFCPSTCTSNPDCANGGTCTNGNCSTSACGGGGPAFVGQCSAPSCSATFPNATCTCAQFDGDAAGCTRVTGCAYGGTTCSGTTTDICTGAVSDSRCSQPKPGAACGAGFNCINKEEEVTVSGVPLSCTDNTPCLPYSGTCVGAPAGFCFVTSACLPSCTINGVTDADCDHISDKDEGFDPTNAPTCTGAGAGNCAQGLTAPAQMLCTSDGTASQHCYIDSDGDGIIDAFDEDSDNDGIPDSIEAGDADPATPPLDSDHDGIPNFRSLDSDGDHISDTIEAKTPGAPIDSDGDGIPDFIDFDSDNDGILDACESVPDGTLSAPTLSNNCKKSKLFVCIDAVGCGGPGKPLCYCADWCANPLVVDHGCTLLAAAQDTDLALPTHDGKPDYLDTDSDNDGVPDKIEARNKPSDPNSVTTPPPDHDFDGLPDYRDLDSDNDGVPDDQEDRNGNGIVDCQLDTSGNPVPDTRPTPGCGGTYSFNAACGAKSQLACTTPASGSTTNGAGCGWGATTPNTCDTITYNYDYNPDCVATGHKCMFEETSRIDPDTDANAVIDGADGNFLVCSTKNLKPINVFFSPAVDYAIALEQSFSQVSTLKIGANEVGLAFDDQTGSVNGSNVVNNDVAANGSYVVSGFLIEESPTAAAIGAGNAPTNLVTKAITQEAHDRALLASMATVTSLQLVLTSSTTSFDNFGVVLSRYSVLLSAPVDAATLRKAVAQTLAGGALTLTPALPAVTDETSSAFTVVTETLYRYDSNSDPGQTPTGRVLVIGAVTPAGAPPTSGNQSILVGYDYRTHCSTITVANCAKEVGCVLNGAKCEERADYYNFDSTPTCPSLTTQAPCQAATGCNWNPTSGLCQADVYQLPLFFVDNVATGSNVAQYGDGLGALCQTFNQQNALVDYIWDQDDSGSMITEIENVQTTTQQFFALINNTEADYRIAQTTSASGTSNWPRTFDFSFEPLDTGRTDSLNGKGGGNRLPPVAGTLVGDFTGAVAGIVNPAATDRSSVYQCSEGCFHNIAGKPACCPECGGALVATLSTTDPNQPACYFASRLPDDAGDGAEFKVLMSEWAMYRAGAIPTSCATQATQTGCLTLGGCSWNGSACVTVTNYDCNGQSNAVSCNGREACQAFNGNKPACLGSPGCNAEVIGGTYKACVTNDCFGKGTGAGCTGVVNTKGTALCKVTGTAPNNFCTDITGEPQDEPEPQSCEWDPVGGVCASSTAIDCRTYNTQAKCTATTAAPGGMRCVWNAADAICIPQVSSGHYLCEAPDQGTCNALPYLDGVTAGTGNHFCVWDAAFDPAGIVGSCHAELKRSLRPAATKSIIVMSDEDDCYSKDYKYGQTSNCAYGTKGACQAVQGCAWDGTNNVCVLDGDQTAYNANCSGGSRTDGVFPYDNGNCGQYATAATCGLIDGCTWAGGVGPCTGTSVGGLLRQGRVDQASKFYLERGVSLYGIVGDKANPLLPPGSTTAQNPPALPVTPTSWNGGCLICAALNSAALCVVPGCSWNAATGCTSINNPEAVQTEISISENTGGAWGSICAVDRSPTIEAIIEGTLGKASPYQLAASINGQAVQPIAATIEVAVEVCNNAAEYPHCRTNDPISAGSGTHDVVVPRSVDNGWDYNPTFNTLIMFGTARPAAFGTITVSYRYWTQNFTNPVGSVCPATSPCPQPGGGCACASGSVCETDTKCTTVACPLGPGNCPAPAVEQTNCNATSGCSWEPSLNACVSSGACTIDATCNSVGGCSAAEGQQCDPSSGQCFCATPCGTAGCTDPALSKCDPTCGGAACPGGSPCGTCVCDKTCGGGCGQGQVCQTSGASCCSCACDTTCGGLTCPGLETCDKNLGDATCGLCVPPKCGSCPDTFTCDPSTGFCVCDTSCGGSCPLGTKCDTTPTDTTCGQCLCDTTCGGVTCPGGEHCDTNADSTCGLCIPNVVCTCPQGQVCNAQGQCIVDQTCGGCDSGFACNPITGLCQPASCPNDYNPSTACSANNLSCCSGAEGTASGDPDGDGVISCASNCGAVENQCDLQPCDCFDSDPNKSACPIGQYCDAVTVSGTSTCRAQSTCPPIQNPANQGSFCNVLNFECCDVGTYDLDGDGFIDCGCSHLSMATCNVTHGCAWNTPVTASPHCTGVPTDAVTNIPTPNTCGNVESDCGVQCCDTDDTLAAVAPCPGSQSCDLSTHQCH